MPSRTIPRDHRQIVAEERFILATRDTGYRGTVAAIAELVDNAIQARARTVQIFLTEGGDRREGRWVRSIEVSVLDDGEGMNKEQLWTALQFGGSSRFADRAGLGRFGMGLPNSSVSQSRRIEVYSWRSLRRPLFTYLDVDDVAQGRLRSIPRPSVRELPPNVQTLAADHGTLVVWQRCDRLDFRKASTLAGKLYVPLGRIYRRALWGGLCIAINGLAVEPIDPLFCHPDTRIGGAVQYGNELVYEFEGREGCRGSVRARFTLLPVLEWSRLPAEQKRRMGIIQGAGISFLRGGREIDTGWKLFGSKRRENYDDWWRCEVLFSPELDEEFGVTHSKQGVNPSPLLRSTLGPDFEAIARTLNARVRGEFALIQRGAPGHAVARASSQDRKLPALRGHTSLRGTAGVTYGIQASPLESASFFLVERSQGRLLVTLNTSHPFYQQLYSPRPGRSEPDLRFALELVLLAAARAELDARAPDSMSAIDRYREAWSDAIAAFLDSQ